MTMLAPIVQIRRCTDCRIALVWLTEGWTGLYLFAPVTRINSWSSRSCWAWSAMVD